MKQSESSTKIPLSRRINHRQKDGSIERIVLIRVTEHHDDKRLVAILRHGNIDRAAIEGGNIQFPGKSMRIAGATLSWGTIQTTIAIGTGGKIILQFLHSKLGS